MSMLASRRSSRSTSSKSHRKNGRARSRRRLVLEPLEGRRLLATIAGQLIYDLDADGLLESEEPGLAGWRVFLDQNSNGIWDGEPSAFTDAGGNYLLEGLNPGSHVVARQAQPGWRQTSPPGTGRTTVVVRTQADAIADVNFGEHREFTPFTPGNVLVTRGSFVDRDLLLEYTPQGSLVQSLVIPGTEDLSRRIAKDLVVDANGRVQIFDGYDDVRLTTFDPATGSFLHAAVPAWDMGRAVNAWGDVAAFGGYVFANEHLDDAGTADGLIRFDAGTLEYQRFSSGIGRPTEVAVGLDGFLYSLTSSGENTTVYTIDPSTMAVVRTQNVGQALRAAAVDASGSLYAITSQGLALFGADGLPVRLEPSLTGDDLAISRDGRLLLSSPLAITLIDAEFGVLSSWDLPGDAATNFTAFAAFVQSPVDQTIPGGEVDYGVLTPGNILVSSSPATGGPAQLLELTSAGQLVQAWDIPDVEAGGARDLVTDASGNVWLFNGTFQPELTAFDAQSGAFLPGGAAFPGWNTLDRPEFGGLASYGKYLYATDTRAGDDPRSERGIVRFDTEFRTFVRFAEEAGDTVDVTVGLDGLLYALGPANGAIGNAVRQYHPVTRRLLKTITLQGSPSHRAIAVDANGDIFAVEPAIHRYSSNGSPLGQPLDPGTLDGLADIDLDADGRLLVAARDGRVLLTDRSLQAQFTFLARSSDGRTFAAFVSPSRPFPKAVADTFTVLGDGTTHNLDLLANDLRLGAAPLSVASLGTPSRGGTVAISPSGGVDYTPAVGFVGVETFTYLASAAAGHTDQAIVEVKVDGTASFRAVDDVVAVVEDAATVVPASGVLANDGALDIFPVLTRGNLLVVHSPVGMDVNALLQEYTPAGTLVRTVILPDFSGGFGDVRDVVLDRNGNVQIYNGTFSPRLTTYDPVAATLEHTALANWNTAPNNTYGGLAAWRNFVFATDQRVGGDDANRHEGIVRFDVDTGAVQRFVDDGDFIDLAVGLDGLLYALGPGGTPTSRMIRVFQPSTMQFVREITGLNANLRAITVDRNGEIFAVNFRDPRIYRYNRNGVLQQSHDTGLRGEADFSDIDLHQDGVRLLIANVNFSNTANLPGSPDGDILLTNRFFFGAPVLLQAPDANSDMKFAAWVQEPVGSLAAPLRVAAHTDPNHGVLSINPDGGFTYTPAADFSGSDSYTYVVGDAAGKQRDATVTLNVSPQNDRPVLTPASPAGYADEDNVLTFPLQSLVNGGPGTTAVADADPRDPLGGIAVTGLAGPGTWSFSLDGTVYVGMGAVSERAALLLPPEAELRFTPSGGAGGVVAFTYRAWDGTRGATGNKSAVTYDVCLAGGNPDATGLCLDGQPPAEFSYDAFSDADDTLTITLTDLNDAPILLPSRPNLGLTDEHTALSARVQDFALGISDPDGPIGVQGIAVIGTIGNGRWESSRDGVVFQPLPTVSPVAALLLDPGDYVRYVPDGLNGEQPGLSYRAWDRTDGALVGSTVDVRVNGGSTAYSAAVDTASVVVGDVNDAPLLTPQEPRIGATDVVTSFSVSLDAFVSGITDVDRGATVGGIALIAASGQGAWSYSKDGTRFTPLPAVSEGAALLLHRTTVVRYAPTGGLPETASLEYVAWDATAGAAGTLADVSLRGGATPFSSFRDLAYLVVKEVNDPPLLDPPGGNLAYQENQLPLAVLADLTVADADSPDFDGGALTVSLVAGGTASDRLGLAPTGGIVLDGSSVLFDDGTSTRPIGTYSIAGMAIAVQFTTADATPAAAQALARSVTFHNDAENPSPEPRTVRLSLNDGDGGNSTSVVARTVAVQPVNDRPQARRDAYEVAAGGSLEVGWIAGVLGNDFDVEGDPLSAVLLVAPQHGILIFNIDGSFNYQPDLLYYGDDAFTYRASDGQGFSEAAQVDLTVKLDAHNSVQAGDVNADGFLSALDPLLIANRLADQGAGPLPGTYAGPPFLDVNDDGLVSQTDLDSAVARVDAAGPRQLPPPSLVIPGAVPDPGPDKLVRVTLRTSDLAGRSIGRIDAGEPFFLEAWVADWRSSPLGVFAAYADASYDPGKVALDGSLAAGADFPNYRAGSTALPGLVDEAGGGRSSRLPGGEEHLLWRLPMRALARGEAIFQLDAADQQSEHPVLLSGWEGAIPEHNIALAGTMLQISGPPLANPDSYLADEDLTLEVDAAAGVLANDRDDEGDTLSALLVDPPAHGTLELRADGGFTYAPDADYSGQDRFTYRAGDGRFESELAAVAILVRASNDPPVANADQYTVYRDTPLTVAVADGLLANDADADGDPLQVFVVSPPSHGQLAMQPNGAFTYSPDAGFGGPDQFRYELSDGTTRSSAVAVDIQVLFDWQNPHHAVDVNGDGYATSLDALLVFNAVDRTGNRVLPRPPAPPDVAPPFLDVSGNGVLSALDGMLVLDDLDARGARILPEPKLVLAQQPPQPGPGSLVQFRLEVVSVTGTPVTQVEAGEIFFVDVYAVDLRSGGRGVFSAYADVGFDAGGLSLVEPPAFGPAFPHARQAGLSAGLLDEVGATASGTAPTGSQARLMRLAMAGSRSGSFTISTAAADVLPQGDVTLFGIDGPIPQDQIAHGSATVFVHAADADSDGVPDAVEDGAPQGGDANGDGIPDRQQAHVGSLPAYGGTRYAALVSSPDRPFRNLRAIPSPSPADSPADVQFQLGFFAFEILAAPAGASASVALQWDGSAPGNVAYQYGSTPERAAAHWYPFLKGPATGATIRSSDVLVQWVDGGRGDHDRMANGMITSVLGVGWTPTPWRNPAIAEDVNNDGAVTPEDSLALVSRINAQGVRGLPYLPTIGESIPPLLDPSGDNVLSPEDVLAVVNRLNAGPIPLAVGGEGESGDPLRLHRGGKELPPTGLPPGVSSSDMPWQRVSAALNDEAIRWLVSGDELADPSLNEIADLAASLGLWETPDDCADSLDFDG